MLTRGALVLALLAQVLLGGLAAPDTSFAAGPTLDQSFTEPPGLGSAINECCRYVAQTFTAGVSGRLVGVAVDVGASRVSPVVPMRVAVRAAPGGIPGTGVLGEASVAAGGADLAQLVTFPTAIDVAAGHAYAIVVDYPAAPPAGAGQGRAVWGGAVDNAYTRGALFFSTDGIDFGLPDPGFDLHFRTFVARTVTREDLPLSTGGPYRVYEGDAAVLRAAGTDPEGQTLRYAWDLDGDGSFETAGASVRFSAAALDGPLTRPVAAQATTRDGRRAVARTTVEVLNARPTATFAVSPATVDEGGTLTATFSAAADPFPADTAAGFWYAVGCGGGWSTGRGPRRRAAPRWRARATWSAVGSGTTTAAIASTSSR